MWGFNDDDKNILILMFIILLTIIAIISVGCQGSSNIINAAGCMKEEFLLEGKCVSQEEVRKWLENVGKEQDSLDRQIQEKLNRINPKYNSAYGEGDNREAIGGEYQLCEDGEIMLWNNERNNFYCGPASCSQWVFNEEKSQYDCGV